MDRKNAVLYLRYSSTNQTEQSIEGQRRVCEEYADREGIKIIGEYVDRATSASHDTHKRKNFLRMIKDSYSETFDFVLVYKLDRFARTRYDSALYKHKLAESGVKVLSATERLMEGSGSVMMESFLEGMAEYYSYELSEKVKRGMRESAEKRQCYGSSYPLGIMVKDKKFVPDPDTRWIPEKVFRDYLAGSSLKEIAQDLADRGVRGRKGKKLGPQTISKMLHNEKYIGVYRFKDVIYDPDAIEPIIDRETFEKAQRKLKENNKQMRKRPKAKEDESLLKGKIFCGHCGAAMTPITGTGRRGVLYRYYKCDSKRRRSDCHKRNEPKERIEKLVLEDASQMLSDEMIEQMATMVMDSLGAPHEEMGILKKQIEQTQSKIDNFTEVIGRGITSDAIIAKLLEAEDDLKVMTAKLDELENFVPNFTKEDIVFYLEQLRQNPEDPDFAKRIIDVFVDRIDVFDDPDNKDGGRLVIKYRPLEESRCVRLSSLCPRHFEQKANQNLIMIDPVDFVIIHSFTFRR